MPTTSRIPENAKAITSIQSRTIDTGGSSRILTGCGASSSLLEGFAFSFGVAWTFCATAACGLGGFSFALAPFWTDWPLLALASAACRETGGLACMTDKSTARTKYFMAETIRSLDHLPKILG